jgi:hypothetical protein
MTTASEVFHLLALIKNFLAYSIGVKRHIDREYVRLVAELVIADI